MYEHTHACARACECAVFYRKVVGGTAKTPNQKCESRLWRVGELVVGATNLQHCVSKGEQARRLFTQ